MYTKSKQNLKKNKFRENKKFGGKFNKTGNLNTTENQTYICEGLGSSQFDWKAASKGRQSDRKTTSEEILP